MTPSDALSALVNGAKPAELPALAGELARALSMALARSAEPTAAPAQTPVPERNADTLLTVEQAAERLGVATSWLYRHAKKLPFTRKLGHRTLRFDARALERWAGSRPSA